MKDFTDFDAPGRVGRLALGGNAELFGHSLRDWCRGTREMKEIAQWLRNVAAVLDSDTAS